MATGAHALVKFDGADSDSACLEDTDFEDTKVAELEDGKEDAGDEEEVAGEDRMSKKRRVVDNADER